MSLVRFVYYSAVIGGWSALLGWALAEGLLGAGDPAAGWWGVISTCAVIGAAIGAGLSLVAGMANARWKHQLRRLPPALLAGGLGGALGGALGELAYSALGLPRALGWMVMGAAIGLGEGLSERSRREVRHGLIGGTLGGLVGGLLFDPILAAIPSGTGMTSRATAFVLLGLCVGALIGLVRVVLKEAWLTVLDGYRPGRQVILGDGVAILGRAEYATLPFLGPGNTSIEWEHVRITPRSDGRYLAEPRPCELGTKLNFQPLAEPVILKDGDVLGLGGNLVRYNERLRGASEGIAATKSASEESARPSPATASVSPLSSPMPRIAAAPSIETHPGPSPSPARAPQAVSEAAAGRTERATVVPTSPASAPRAAGACPRCGRMPAAGQRYCIVCDESF